jgi:hypothetical protein
MSSVSPPIVLLAEYLRVVVSRLRRRIREVADGEDLTQSLTSVLGRSDIGGPAATSDLRAAERVRCQSMSAIPSGLDVRGPSRRDQDATDGGRHVVSLTPVADTWITSSRQAREQWRARALQDWFTAAQGRTICEALTLSDRLAQYA